MSETPNPYSAEARGAPVAAEAQQLSAAYTSGLAGIASQVAHAQNQALIAELLHRQAYRSRTGNTYLTPVRTRVEVPEAPTRSGRTLRPRRAPWVFLHGAMVDRKVFHMCWPLSDGSSKFIPIDEQPNHQIVHAFRLGKAQRATNQPLDPGPEIDVLALDFLRVLLAYVMLLGIEMPLIGPPAVGVILGDAKGL